MQTLTINGCLCRFGTPSAHAMVNGVNGGTVTLYRSDDYIARLEGIPLLAPDGPTQIGAITRAWAEGDCLRVEGEIRDTPEARYWLSRTKCGLCALLEMPALKDGITQLSPDELVISAVRVCLPDKSGFAESWVNFKDPSITYRNAPPPDDRPRALPWFMGKGF